MFQEVQSSTKDCSDLLFYLEQKALSNPSSCELLKGDLLFLGHYQKKNG